MKQILSVWDWELCFFLHLRYILDGTALADNHGSCGCFAQEAVFTHIRMCVFMCAHAHLPVK